MMNICYFKKTSVLLVLFLFNSVTWSQDSPNIILLIGDGMGLTQISAGMYANGNSTALEGFEHIGLSKTSSPNTTRSETSLRERKFTNGRTGDD